MPYEFSKQLFKATSVGGTVVISNDGTNFTDSKGHRIEFHHDDSLESSLQPHQAPSGPVSILFSSKDEKLLVFRNGKLMAEGEADLRMFAAKPQGTYTYICDGWTKDDKGEPHPHWHQISGPSGDDQLKAFGHVKTDAKLKHVIDAIIGKGTTLVLTNVNLTTKLRSDPGFAILRGTLPKSTK